MNKSQNLTRDTFEKKTRKRLIEKMNAYIIANMSMTGGYSGMTPRANTLILTGPDFVDHYNTHIGNVGSKQKFVIAEKEQEVYREIRNQLKDVNDIRVHAHKKDVFDVMFSKKYADICWGVVDLDFCKTLKEVIKDCDLISNLCKAISTGKLRASGTAISITLCQRGDKLKQGAKFLKSDIEQVFESFGWIVIKRVIEQYKDFHGPPMITGLYIVRKNYQTNWAAERKL